MNQPFTSYSSYLTSHLSLLTTYLTQIARIFWHEYWEHVTRRGYLVFTFGFPLFIISMPTFAGLVVGLAAYFAMPATDTRPIGIVDQALLLVSSDEQAIIQAEGLLKTSRDNIPIIFFRSAPEAAVALNTDYIQAYYHLLPDYWDTGEATLTYYKSPNEFTRLFFTYWVSSALDDNISKELHTRLTLGPNFSHKDLGGQSRDFSEVNFVEGAIVYMIIYFVRLVGTSFTANYMFDSIANESDDRTIEILITSVSPLQLLLGKLFGLLTVGFTQLTMWGSLAIIALYLAGQALELNLLGFIIYWPYLYVLISMLLGAYIMDHLLAAALGLLKVSGGAGMQLFSLVNMASGFSLLYATYFIPRNPHTALAVAATFFPLTSPMVLLIRLVVSEVPTWQIILAQALLWLTNMLGVLLLLRLLKNNLLAYKQPFVLRTWLWQKLPSLPYTQFKQLLGFGIK